MDQRNLALAIVLSLIIILGFQFFIMPPPEQVSPAVQGEALDTPSQPESDIPTPPAGDREIDREADLAVARSEIIESTERVRIASPTLSGSIALAGGRIDDLLLTQYRKSLDPKSPQIVLLTPPGTALPYFTDFGWTATDSTIRLPDRDTPWVADGDSLAPGRPVTLTWDNGQGLVFRRSFAMDDHYMFTITQQVENQGEAPVVLSPYGLISRTGTPDILGFYILHEGLIGVFGGALKEVDYDDLRSDRREERIQAQSTTGGWIGITDKYWMTALVPDQKKPVDTRFVYSDPGGKDRYQTDYLYEPVTIEPGAASVVTSSGSDVNTAVSSVPTSVSDSGVLSTRVSAELISSQPAAPVNNAIKAKWNHRPESVWPCDRRPSGSSITVCPVRLGCHMGVSRSRRTR